MKISKNQRAIHNRALALLDKEHLTWEEQQEFFDTYNEAASFDVGVSGAFFTPSDLALDFALEARTQDREETVLDLCAGIGVLSWAYLTRNPKAKITAIEQNPEWVKIGRKLLPNVNWICADISDLDLKALGHFDKVISNPPFGVVPTLKNLKCPRYTGSQAHYKIMDIASCLGDYGTFLLPQQACSFIYSGIRNFRPQKNDALRAFIADTGIDMEMNIGIDTSHYGEFKNTKITTEIACCDFTEFDWPAEHKTVLQSEPVQPSVLEMFKREVREVKPKLQSVMPTKRRKSREVVPDLQIGFAF